MLKGAIHAHSTYSDGDFTLRELRGIFVAAGCAFVCITDHAENFTQRKLEEYISECEKLSSDEFCFVPGLEYECEGQMHILGYGVTALASSRNPEEVIQHIESKGGVSVIAHPRDSAFAWIKTFDVLPEGIETWNTKYDGRFAPRPGTFHLLRCLQDRKPEIKAFYGQDFHYREQFCGLFVQVRSESLRPDGILKALAAGDYMGQHGDLVLPSTGVLSAPLMARFARVRGCYVPMRRALRSIGKMARRMGMKVPEAVLTQARRFFL